MPPYSLPAVIRVILVPGHGWHNSARALTSYDSGATSDCTSLDEAELVRQVAGRVMNMPAPPKTIILQNDDCDAGCFRMHNTYSHLTWTVQHWNRHRMPNDYIIALHANAPQVPRHDYSPSGVEVYYSKVAPYQRREQAEVVARVVSEKLGLPNLGTFKSSESQHSHLAILDDTDAPALLIELGFMTSADDVRAIEECGADAVYAAIQALRGFK